MIDEYRAALRFRRRLKETMDATSVMTHFPFQMTFRNLKVSPRS